MTQATRSDLSYITNVNARAKIVALRRAFSGVHKVYGSRYLEMLAVLCNCSVHAVAVGKSGIGAIVTMKNGVEKTFSTARLAGQFMELTINDWYDLGIL